MKVWIFLSVAWSVFAVVDGVRGLTAYVILDLLAAAVAAGMALLERKKRAAA